MIAPRSNRKTLRDYDEYLYRDRHLSGQMGTDGPWTRLRGGSKKVVLGLVDSVSGLMFPPGVVDDE